MDAKSLDSSTTPSTSSNIEPTRPDHAVLNVASNDASSKQSTSGISSWARNLKIPEPLAGGQDESPTGNSAKSAFTRLASGITMRLSPRDQTLEQGADAASSQTNFIGTLTKGLVDTSRSAVRAVQVKARHVVSQNKRRYQEDGFDLDMTYITENIIAMGFPAGDMSSGFFGYVEGFYRNHMEEVISFLESRHKGKYKVYNLCSERLYDASLFEGKVASFPFDDHNCPPIQLIISFCQSAYSWLKENIENVVAVHCKAGMARTGLMISSLLLYLKFFPTAEETMDYYNQKRCFDGKALVLPSQIRYVKYFERILTYFNGENQPGRRCMLRGFRLHRCPYWIRPHITISNHNGVLFTTKKHPRTKDLTPEDFWFNASKKGIMVFALPGEPGLTELAGDFKVHFHDRQGDFYFWLNTTMIENRKTLDTSDMDGFDKRKLPSPGFQVEVVLVDYDGTPSSLPQPDAAVQKSGSSMSRKQPAASLLEANKSNSSKTNASSDQNVEGLTRGIENLSVRKGSSTEVRSVNNPVAGAGAGTGTGTGGGGEAPGSGVSEFKAMAADASVFTFGDEEDYESE